MHTPSIGASATLIATASLVAAATAVAIAAPALAAVDGVSCAVVTQYTAPDPGAPADGTITIGFGQTSTIAADADLSPAVAAALPNLVGNSPTCLAIETDGAGVITGLDFASIGTVCGAVELDEVNGYYLVADAFIVPVFLVDSDVGFQAMIGVAADAGSELCITFLIDMSFGYPTGFSGTTAPCGIPTVASDGSVQLVGATIPAGVPTPNALATAHVAAAAGGQVCVEVTTIGTIDSQGGIALASTARFALDHCGVVENGAVGALVVDGMELQPASGSVKRSVRTGMHIEVAGDGQATVDAAAVPGCFAAAATPEPSAPPTVEASPTAPAERDTLPDTSAGQSVSDLWWLVILACAGLAGLGLRAHHRPATARSTASRLTVH